MTLIKINRKKNVWNHFALWISLMKHTQKNYSSLIFFCSPNVLCKSWRTRARDGNNCGSIRLGRFLDVIKLTIKKRVSCVSVGGFFLYWVLYLIGCWWCCACERDIGEIFFFFNLELKDFLMNWWDYHVIWLNLRREIYSTPASHRLRHKNVSFKKYNFV